MKKLMKVAAVAVVMIFAVQSLSGQCVSAM